MSDETAGSESPLPPAILRSLGDRSYDKRKHAALEIEALIKALQENNDTDRICSVIAMLGQDFATSTNANHRKGGLIGLAATAIGLMNDIHLYLDALLPPVLHTFDDPESRVRCGVGVGAATAPPRTRQHPAPPRSPPPPPDTTRAKPCTTSPRWPAGTCSSTSTKSSTGCASCSRTLT